jgi:hypothetical protein
MVVQLDGIPAMGTAEVHGVILDDDIINGLRPRCRT